MKKSILITLIVIFTFITIGSSIGIFTYVRGNYSAKIDEKTAEKKEIENKIIKIRNDKDSNDYLPSDVVRNFMNEIRSESYDVAKLYLANDLQSVDLKVALGFDVPVSAVNPGEVTYEVSDESATVKYYYVIENTDDEDFRLYKGFTLERVDDIWKIVRLNTSEE